MGLRIGILGTRGIPNYYGGFEQISAYLAKGLAERGHSVSVYNSHNHPWEQKEWNGVQIIHCYDPEYILGTAGQFIYDFNCIRDARKRHFDVLLIMGYTSSSIWGRLYPKDTRVITNMDGLEWKRSKYPRPVQRFLRYAEKLAIQYSDAHIADSLGIRDYLLQKYHIQASYIPYGAEITLTGNDAMMHSLGLTKGDYCLLIARMEPENNIEMILSGFCQSNTTMRMVVVGNTENDFGRSVTQQFQQDTRIVFTGPVFDLPLLHSLRSNACLYFHGHSVGGTNPSLLEAMADTVLIAAHDNPFNRAILEEDALYFTNSIDIQTIIETPSVAITHQHLSVNNFNKIVNVYNWQSIVDRYEQFLFSQCNHPAIEEDFIHTGYVSQ